MTRHEVVIARLDEVSRQRALTEGESEALEAAIELERATLRYRQLNVPIWRAWTAEEDETAHRLRDAGATYEVISLEMLRTPFAVASRLRALRLREEGR